MGVFTFGYAGRRGIHEEELLNVNQLLPGTVQANPTIKQPDALRPYKGFSNISQATNAGSSMYHSLQANLRRRMVHGFLFGLAYTWSKTMDYGSANNVVLPNTYDRQIYYGVADFDRRHVFVGNFVWDIPYFSHSHGFVRASLGDWQFSGTYQYYRPVRRATTTGSDYAGCRTGVRVRSCSGTARLQRCTSGLGESQSGAAKASDTWCFTNRLRRNAYLPRLSRKCNLYGLLSKEPTPLCRKHGT